MSDCNAPAEAARFETRDNSWRSADCSSVLGNLANSICAAVRLVAASRTACSARALALFAASYATCKSSVDASSADWANTGCSVDPHTGQAVSGKRSRASSPAMCSDCSLRACVNASLADWNAAPVRPRSVSAATNAALALSTSALCNKASRASTFSLSVGCNFNASTAVSSVARRFSMSACNVTCWAPNSANLIVACSAASVASCTSMRSLATASKSFAALSMRLVTLVSSAASCAGDADSNAERKAPNTTESCEETRSNRVPRTWTTSASALFKDS